jgi:hypothetical protein
VPHRAPWRTAQMSWRETCTARIRRCVAPFGFRGVMQAIAPVTDTAEVENGDVSCDMFTHGTPRAPHRPHGHGDQTSTRTWAAPTQKD